MLTTALASTLCHSDPRQARLCREHGDDVDVRAEQIGNVEALIVRVGCWGILYYNHNKEPPKIIGNDLRSYSNDIIRDDTTARRIKHNHTSHKHAQEIIITEVNQNTPHAAVLLGGHPL